MPCLKDNTITDNPSCDPSPSSIPVEEETISEPTLEPPQEPEINSESSALSSSTPVLETSDPILDGSDEEEEHPEAQTQALRDYQLARHRVCRVPKDHPRCISWKSQLQPVVAVSTTEAEYIAAKEAIWLQGLLSELDARAAQVGHPSRPLATHGPSARLLFNYCCFVSRSSLSPCLPVGELRPVSEGYNPDRHFSSISTPRRGNIAARSLVLVW
ncbi:hypothetical protein M9H77_25784 [Catharanthus roseus]|uniref:Uncharacterized protein n=1 Tax=Catharanthus roseus TaxID=4058 RepID=A0ACC0A8S9_CATRO|nr:hypothetical protein M9H77_25784 [Catharanthus roseus]